MSGLESGKSGFSSNINESKKRGVDFKSKSVIKVDNEDKMGKEIQVNEFWYENMWMKGQSANEVKIDSANLQYSATINTSLNEDSLCVVYNKNYGFYLGVFHSQMYAYAYLKKSDVPDTVVLEFFIKKNGKNKKIKTVLFK